MHILISIGLNLKPIFRLTPHAFDSLYGALVIGHQWRCQFPLQLTGRERLVLDVFLLLPSANSQLYSASLEFHPGVHLAPSCRARTRDIFAGSQRALTNSIWSCCKSQTTWFHIVWRSPNSLSTVPRTTSIIIGPLHVFDVKIAEARDARFGAAVGGQKHAVNLYDDHSNEMSRTVTQGEEGRVQFDKFP